MFNIYKNIFIWTRSITIKYGALDSGPFGQAVDLFVFNLSRKERHNCYQYNMYIFATLCVSYFLDSSDLNFSVLHDHIDNVGHVHVQQLCMTGMLGLHLSLDIPWYLLWPLNVPNEPIADSGYSVGFKCDLRSSPWCFNTWHSRPVLLGNESSNLHVFILIKICQCNESL